MMISFKKHLIGAVTLSAAVLFALGQAPAVANAATHGPGDATTNLSGNTATTVTPAVAFEATDANGATGRTTSQFTVEPGTLQLVAVPDLNFGAVPAKTIINGGTQGLESNTVKNVDVTSKDQTDHAFDGNNRGDVVVTDYRGTTSGWRLNLAMNSTFTTVDNPDKPLSNITLNLKSAVGKNSFEAGVAYDRLTNTAAIGESTGAVGQQITKIVTDHGVGKTTYKINASNHATLNFPANTNHSISENVYQSDLLWTLVVAQ